MLKVAMRTREPFEANRRGRVEARRGSLGADLDGCLNVGRSALNDQMASMACHDRRRQRRSRRHTVGSAEDGADVAGDDAPFPVGAALVDVREGMVELLDARLPASRSSRLIGRSPAPLRTHPGAADRDRGGAAWRMRDPAFARHAVSTPVLTCRC
jgi:hypothetical protein